MHGREERLRQTSNWLGAIPVDVMRRPMLPADELGLDPLDIAQTVTMIRETLAQGVSTVRVTERDPDKAQAIYDQLSVAEKQRVIFDAGQNRPASERVEAANAATIPHALPTVELPEEPGVIRVEDLKPL
jgi:hypothetical protein